MQARNSSEYFVVVSSTLSVTSFLNSHSVLIYYQLIYLIGRVQ